MKALLGGPLLALSAVVLAAGIGVLPRWRTRAWLRVGTGLVVILVSLIGSTVDGYWLWFTHRRQPEPVREQWFTGVSYERHVLQQPRPVVAHLVRVDLEAPGLELLVTAPQPSASGDLLAEKTSAFAARHGLQVAINASFFYPFRNGHPLDYEPHVGDPVYVVGTAASAGRGFGQKGEKMIAMYLSRDRKVSFEQPLGEVWHALSGFGYVVREGAPVTFEDTGVNHTPYPRTLAAVDATGRYLLLLVVDGKQPHYSDGLTLEEAARLLVEQGARTGIQLDGGGSSTLVRQGARGEIQFVNTPINFRIAGWERVVATHLGIFARPLEASGSPQGDTSSRKD
jgi:hypothetical protein